MRNWRDPAFPDDYSALPLVSIQEDVESNESLVIPWAPRRFAGAFDVDHRDHAPGRGVTMPILG